MRNVLLKLQDSRFPSCPMAELLEKSRIWRICSDKSASKTPEIHLVWMGEMLEKPRVCRSSSAPNIKMSQTIAHPKLHFTPGLGQLSAQIDGQRMPLAGRFSSEGMAIFLRFFPAGPSLEEFALELLCQTQLRQQIAASESRTSESRRTKKGLEAHPLSKFCVHCHALHSFVGSPQERNPVASESPKRSPVASENRSVRESQAQKGLEAHPLSEPCVQLHTLDCFVGSPPERNLVASENRSVRESHVRESHVRESQAQPALLSQPVSHF